MRIVAGVEAAIGAEEVAEAIEEVAEAATKVEEIGTEGPPPGEVDPKKWTAGAVCLVRPGRSGRTPAVGGP